MERPPETSPPSLIPAYELCFHWRDVAVKTATGARTAPGRR
jgi:hypothetical protein